MGRFRFHIIFAGCFGILVGLLGWLLTADVIPASASLMNVIGSLHLIPLLVSDLVSGNIHGESFVGSLVFWTLSVVQWSIVGFGVAFLFKRPTAQDSGAA